MDEAQKIMASRGTATLDDIAKKNNLKVYESDPFTFSKDGYIKGKDVSIESKTAMIQSFSMNVDEISGPFEGKSGDYIIQLLERQMVDDTKLAQAKAELDKLRDQLIKQKQQMIYNTWYQRVRATTSVKTFISFTESS